LFYYTPTIFILTVDFGYVFLPIYFGKTRDAWGAAGRKAACGRFSYFFEIRISLNKNVFRFYLSRKKVGVFLLRFK